MLSFVGMAMGSWCLFMRVDRGTVLLILMFTRMTLVWHQRHTFPHGYRIHTGLGMESLKWLCLYQHTRHNGSTPEYTSVATVKPVLNILQIVTNGNNVHETAVTMADEE